MPSVPTRRSTRPIERIRKFVAAKPLPEDPAVDDGEGFLVLQKSEKVEIRAEISNFTGKPMFSVREWIKKGDGWIRTQKGFMIDPGQVVEFSDALASVISDLFEQVPPPRKRR